MCNCGACVTDDVRELLVHHWGVNSDEARDFVWGSRMPLETLLQVRDSPHGYAIYKMLIARKSK